MERKEQEPKQFERHTNSSLFLVRFCLQEVWLNDWADRPLSRHWLKILYISRYRCMCARVCVYRLEGWVNASTKHDKQCMHLCYRNRASTNVERVRSKNIKLLLLLHHHRLTSAHFRTIAAHSALFQYVISVCFIKHRKIYETQKAFIHVRYVDHSIDSIWNVHSVNGGVFSFALRLPLFGISFFFQSFLAFWFSDFRVNAI